MNDSTTYDLVVVGGGVVGLAILRAATLEGWKCALVESESDLLSNASGSNSGIICTGTDASPGTLERALIRDSISQMRIFCKDHNIPTRPCGSLVCLWPWDDDKGRLSDVLEESHDAGDTHAATISSSDIKELEPNLAPSCQGAVHIPGEVVVDPWLYSITFAVHARENGADIFTDFAFDPGASSFERGIWTAVGRSKNNGTLKTLRARAISNAAGLWSDTIQKKGIGSSEWISKPRRGQYRIFSSSSATRLSHPIQPIPTQRTKGIFVFSSLYDQIVVGPTALDQDSKTDRSIDSEVAKELNAHVRRIIPELDTQKSFVGEYVGLRPGSNQRDYQIHIFPDKRWITVAGIRSTGLTASLGIGNYVARSLRSILKSPKEPPVISTTPLPSLTDLVDDFHSRNGFVEINGHQYRVTHPLTKFGWSMLAKEGSSVHDSKL